MPIKNIEVVECEKCHRLQDKKTAEYVEVVGSITLHYYKNGHTNQKSLVAGPYNTTTPPTTFCSNCASVLLREAVESVE